MRRLARPLMYTGVVVIVAVLAKYHAAEIGGYDLVNSYRFAWAITYVVLLCIAAYGLGLPDLPRTLRSRIATSFGAPLTGALAISVVQLFVGDALLPRFVVFGAALALVPWFLTVAKLAGAGRTALEARDRVVVIGPSELAADLGEELERNPEKPAALVGRLSERAASMTDALAKPVIEMVLDRGASVVVLSADAQGDDRIVDQAAQLHEAGIRVRTQSLFYEEWLGKIPIADLGRVALFFDIGEVHRERFARVKRVFDVIAGILGALALALIVPLVLLGNLVANRGPLFYSQDRVGRYGVVFRIQKFRTMRVAADVPTSWTSEGDPRVTPFGRILRKSHLDELPQVWNILRGDLSLVGPRPEQPLYVAELVEKLPFYDLRHIVRPGLTGWAQVNYGYAADERGALEKLQYDFHYLRRQSLLFDIRIIGRTVRSILGSEGAGR